MKTYSVTLDESVVAKAQELNADEKLSPLINRLLSAWNKSHNNVQGKKAQEKKTKAKSKPKDDLDILGDEKDLDLGDVE